MEGLAGELQPLLGELGRAGEFLVTFVCGGLPLFMYLGAEYILDKPLPKGGGLLSGIPLGMNCGILTGLHLFEDSHNGTPPPLAGLLLLVLAVSIILSALCFWSILFFQMSEQTDSSAGNAPGVSYRKLRFLSVMTTVVLVGCSALIEILLYIWQA